MNYRKVTAIFPELALDKVEHNLVELGVSGMTVSKTHGFGEYRNYYTQDCMTDCVRVEIFTEMKKAKAIAGTIARTVHRDSGSDGVIAILPVEHFMSIREYEEAMHDG